MEVTCIFVRQDGTTTQNPESEELQGMARRAQEAAAEIYSRHYGMDIEVIEKETAQKSAS